MAAQRVLGVSGSPRRGGNTECAVRTALRVLSEGGHDVQFQRLADHHVASCAGCRRCMVEHTCAIRDDELESVLAPWLAADVIVLGSPVYWLSPPGVLKDFMDRTHGWYAVGGLFAGKRAALISVAADSGFETHDAAILAWLRYYGASIAATARVLARDQGDLEARPEELAKVVALAQVLL